MHPRLYDAAYWHGETSNYTDGGYHDGPHLQRDADAILDCVDVGGRVLEIGCAYGFVLRRLTARMRCVGVDLSRHALRIAGHAGLDVIQASATDLPLRDHGCDLAYSRDTLEHIPHARLAEVIGELDRVCRAGLHFVTVEGQRTDDKDRTHVTMRPLAWWQMRLPKTQVVAQA